MLLDREIYTIIINDHGFKLSKLLKKYIKKLQILTTEEISQKYNLNCENILFFKNLKDIFRYVVEHRYDTVAFMASGIAVREIYAVSKYTDAAIVLVDNCGRYAISLMSGHEGGANFLAYNVASLLGAEPIVTTFTEVSKKLILGLGCRKGVKAVELVDTINFFLEQHSIEHSDIRHIATCAIKLEEEGIWEMERIINIPVYFVPKEKIGLPYFSFNESTAKRYFDIPSVAEASALLSGKNALLKIPKKVYKDVTLALAEEKL
ncbi:MAG: cobalamin biosynthesis protein [Calditerrivibrio sp.]|nr:cobalamin biosynthesis protein [Calditerrivibrio sp.]